LQLFSEIIDLKHLFDEFPIHTRVCAIGIHIQDQKLACTNLSQQLGGMRIANGWPILAFLCTFGHELKRRAEPDQSSERNRYPTGSIGIALLQAEVETSKQV
jgi:hypothetical protein